MNFKHMQTLDFSEVVALGLEGWKLVAVVDETFYLVKDETETKE